MLHQKSFRGYYLMAKHLRSTLETAAIIIAGFTYVFFQKQLMARPFFIIPIIAFLVIYLVIGMLVSKRDAASYGLTTKNLGESFMETSSLAIPAICVMVTWGLTRGNTPSANFYCTLLLYPLWGFAQQFLFQGILFENLEKLGCGRWSIPLTALIFCLFHWPEPILVGLTFFGGLAFSSIYARSRTIWAIGFYHGIIGSIAYYFLLNQDPLTTFLN